MNETVDIDIQLFGAFRNFGNGRELRLEVARGSALSDVRAALARKLIEFDPQFNNTQLIEDSAFANESEVLSAEFTADHSCRLAILPPVCGG